MIAQNLVWVEFFILLSILMLVLVPQKTIIKLLPFGITAGFMMAFIIQLIAVPVLHLWRFNYISFATYKGIPLFIAMAWIPSIIIFAYYITVSNKPIQWYLISVGFALISTIVEYLFVYYGYRFHIQWNIAATFILALTIHTSLALYLIYQKQT
jgi:hypothetical protein